MKGKKLLSLILSIAMTLSMFSGLSMTTASAAVGDATNNIWTASAADATKVAGDTLYTGNKGTLTTLMNVTHVTQKDENGTMVDLNEVVGSRTFTSCIKSTDAHNGGWDKNADTIPTVDKNGVTQYPSILKFIPAEAGVVTAYFINPTAGKYLCITKEGTDTVEGSLVYTAAPGTSTSISAELEAGETYYIYVNGSKGNFAAVDFEAGATYVPATPAPATPVPTLDPNVEVNTWAASYSTTAGQLLMTGLSAVSDLTYSMAKSTFDGVEYTGYITGGTNVDWNKTVGAVNAGSTSLKYEAAKAGNLKVYISGLGSAKSVYVMKEGTTECDATTAVAVLENTEAGKINATVEFTAEADATYYIFGKGTNARFVGAKFTPAGEVSDATTAPSTDTPANTDTPVTGGITYENNTVTVKANNPAVTDGVLLYAQYDNGALVSVTSSALTFTDGVATATVENAPKGSKFMAWDSLQGMKPLCDSYTIGDTVTPGETTQPGETTDPNATLAPQATRDPSLPEKDEAWTTLDSELNAIVGAAADGTAWGPYEKLSGYGKFDIKEKTASYTHTDGTTYNFALAWQGGTGSKTKKNFYFTPEEACYVTVAYSAQSGRPVYIYQGDTLLASGEEGLSTSGEVAILRVDVMDPDAGDVYVYGGSSNKQIYGIFVDYYNPDIITYNNVSGSVEYTGTKDMSAAKLVFTPTNNLTRATEVEVDYANPYTVSLVSNTKYDISVKGVEDICATLDTDNFELYRKDITHNIELVDIVEGEVTGEVVTHGLDMSDVVLTFTDKNDATYTKTATLAAATDAKLSSATHTLSVVLEPNREYTVTATGNDGYTLSPLSGSYTMVAGDTNPFKNILFTKDVAPIAYKDTLTVGTDKEYKTISEALKAVETMTGRTAGEQGRVEIVVDAGTYTEQLQVKSPHVTIKAADEANKPKITFYYGIGYLYHSAVDGYYSEDAFVQQTTYGTVDRWGAVVRVTGTNFLAENIIFENSLNCRVTPEEIEDGVWAAPPGWYGDVSNKPDRTVEGYDARTQAATERGAAFAGDGTNYELYNCEFISSQDTLFTGKNGYFKNCYIEGGTDFIFGGSSIMFEDCTLAWHGYSDKEKGGYLTACSTSASWANGLTLDSNGYYFKDSTIVNSKYYTENKFDAGLWGRNWGGANCKVVFDGVTLGEGISVPGGWSRMGGDLETSALFVNDVKDAKGNAVTLTGTTAYNVTAEDVASIDPLTYFGDWVPVHYEGYVPEKTTYTTTWYFGHSNGAPDYALQGAGQTVEIQGATDAETAQVLVVDASVGKFNNMDKDGPRTDEWAQVNNGTTFTLPVVNGSVVSLASYQGGGILTASNGGTVTDAAPYTYVGEAGTLTFTVTNGGYMSSIKVVSPIDPEPYVPAAYDVIITAAENGTVTADTTDGKANYGAVVTVTATPNEGYKLSTLTVTTASGTAVELNATNQFTMPNEAVTITATFAVKPSTPPEEIDWEMDFRAAAPVVDGVAITTQNTYKLFDDFVVLNNMKADNDHGIVGNGPIDITVSGPVEITVGACAYTDAKLVLKNGGTVVDEVDDFVGDQQAMADGTKGPYSCYSYNNGSATLNYTGSATTLSLSFESSTNGAATNARFWLPYLAVKSTGEAPVDPTTAPTEAPTEAPTLEPTATPTLEPTATPTLEPTATPTLEPTATPTLEPTATPTLAPTAEPTAEPTATPTTAPTEAPVKESAIVIPAIELDSNADSCADSDYKEYSAWESGTPDEVKEVFGDPIAPANVANYIRMNSEGKTVSKTVSLNGGDYKVLVLSVQYGSRYFTVDVNDGDAISPLSQDPAKYATASSGANNTNLTVTEYDLGTLAKGEYKIDINSAVSNSRNIFAVAVVPVVIEKETLKISGASVTGGRQNDTSSEVWKFVDGSNADVKALFADADDATAIDSTLTASKVDYVGGTGSSSSHPSIGVSLAVGKYKLYYFGYNHGVGMSATLNDTALTVVNEGGTDFAYLEGNTERIAKYYEMDINVTETVKNGTITFDTTAEYLPDLYSVIIVPVE